MSDLEPTMLAMASLITNVETDNQESSSYQHKERLITSGKDLCLPGTSQTSVTRSSDGGGNANPDSPKGTVTFILGDTPSPNGNENMSINDAFCQRRKGEGGRDDGTLEKDYMYKVVDMVNGVEVCGKEEELEAHDQFEMAASIKEVEKKKKQFTMKR